MADPVSRKLDYLIIGADGNPYWAYACYGRKVEMPVALQKAGARIPLIHENDIHDAVADARRDRSVDVRRARLSSVRNMPLPILHWKQSRCPARRWENCRLYGTIPMSSSKGPPISEVPLVQLSAVLPNEFLCIP